jgi:WD40 repeat protein
VWDLETGVCLDTLRGHVDGVLKITLSPDEKSLVSLGEYNTAVLWDLKSAGPVWTYPGRPGSIKALLQADEGLTVILAQKNRALVIWDVAERLPYLRT